MSFRTVVISNKSKLSYKNNYLVVKKEDNERYIHISEIDTVIIDSITVSITSYLLLELSNNKVNIIFCNEKRSPYSQLIPFYNSYNTSKKVLLQTKWTKKIKDEMWQKIIENKILNQATLLIKLKKNNSDTLISYAKEVQLGDKTNREGHAAKVYFNSLFGKKFSRNQPNDINAALNYGYAIILSAINKEISINGYITELGINHRNDYNYYNLTCDFMEPLRILIDEFVYHNRKREFNKEYKMDLVNILNHKYKYQNKELFLTDIIKLYVRNIFKCIEKNEIESYKRFII